jgi:aspartyl protease family protein
MGAWLALSLLVGAGLLLVLRNDAGTIAGFDNAQVAAIISGAAVVIFLWSAMSRGYRGRKARAHQDAVTWAPIGFSLVALYSYREDLMPYAERFAQRIAGEIVPGTPEVVETRTGDTIGVRIKRGWDGHFIAKTEVNGVALRMIVDTGASTVVLRPDDARKLGIDIDHLTYSVPVQTANGISRAARIRLDKVAVGPVGYSGVEALIAQPGALHQSLLGMSFLSRLRSYEFSGDVLTLRS